MKKKKEFENNWLSKSLESLEKDFWKEPEGESYLVTTCFRLRKKQLKQFTIEDLRIMIGQNIGLKYLIPIAIEQLNENILAEGDFYEGDLLNSVFSSDRKYWLNNEEHWSIVCKLFENNKETLQAFDTTKPIRDKMFSLYQHFRGIHAKTKFND